jgi:flagellar motor switch protein FliG
MNELQELAPEALALGLRGERAPTVSMLLGGLEPAKAAEVLKHLPPEIRHETAVRLGSAAPPARELLVHVSKAVLERCRKLAEAGPEPTVDDRLMRLADMVRALGTEDRQAIVQRLQATDPATAAKVASQLYRFEDVLRVEDRALQGILSQLDMKALAAALKNASEEISAKILANVSKRARDAVNEEMELSGHVPPARIKEAQEKVINVIRQLDQEGKLTL